MDTKQKFVTCFAPGHITGFFTIHENDYPSLKGTTGCGLVLNRGVTVKVCSSPDITETEIFLNGSKKQAPVTSHLVASLSCEPVRIESHADIPVGCGFGASGAGAMATSYCLNDLFSLGLTQNELVEAAHVAEVVGGGGLGDVEAQAHGGIVIRKRPAPVTKGGLLDRIVSPSFSVHCVALGKLSTKKTLSDSSVTGKINIAGKTAMKNLLLNPTIEEFMLQSRSFSFELGLLSKGTKDIIEAVENVGGFASQAMLGDAVFAIAGPECTDTVLREVMSEFGTVFSSTVAGTD
ncbi:pantoate kinase [Methanohalophilus halophilus]|uniref:Pantoate kinase n=1 Tax=Methanohalophilus halophilus TaxID=2177 RepID=A0A1L3PZW1_9EURY|nr:pantoate kinase [Methanohalophilus halophilus]APH38167.1 pantothenate kinase [Methanohalophilus halophilus]RNI10964.1 pantothenate kinase [Methanohalophilus halophilus]SDW80186.1 pantothenate kinase [Methanohalophilus halophilus]